MRKKLVTEEVRQSGKEAFSTKAIRNVLNTTFSTDIINETN